MKPNKLDHAAAIEMFPVASFHYFAGLSDCENRSPSKEALRLRLTVISSRRVALGRL